MLWSKCSSEHPSFRAALEWPMTLTLGSWIQVMFSSEQPLFNFRTALIWGCSKEMRGAPKSISFRTGLNWGYSEEHLIQSDPKWVCVCVCVCVCSEEHLLQSIIWSTPEKGTTLKKKILIRRFLTQNWTEPETEKQVEQTHECGEWRAADALLESLVWDSTSLRASHERCAESHWGLRLPGCRCQEESRVSQRGSYTGCQKMPVWLVTN